MNLFFYVQMMAVVRQTQCAVPGAFFWKPRTEVDLTGDAAAGRDRIIKVHFPSYFNIRMGKVMLINGYRMGTTVMAIAYLGTARPKFPQYDIFHADFYNNAYRWALRAISLIPEWLASAGSYPDAHKAWTKRFYFMDARVPKWMRTFLFFVDGWGEEEKAWRRYRIYAKPAFDKHLRYPSPVTNLSVPFASFKQTKETVENLDDSSAETPKPRSLHPWNDGKK